MCLACPDGCTRCTSSAHCTECDKKHILHQGQCQSLDNCRLRGYPEYQEQLHHQCLSCPSHCAFCHETSRECSLCKRAFHLSQSECRACPDNCLVCLDRFTCLVCSPDFVYKDRQCIALGMITNSADFERISREPTWGNQQPGALWESPLVESADPKCFFESRVSPSKCVICQSGYFLSTVTSKCTACPDNCSLCRDDRLCSECTAGHSLAVDQASHSIVCRANVSGLTRVTSSARVQSARCLGEKRLRYAEPRALPKYILQKLPVLFDLG